MKKKLLKLSSQYNLIQIIYMYQLVEMENSWLLGITKHKRFKFENSLLIDNNYIIPSILKYFN